MGLRGFGWVKQAGKPLQSGSAGQPGKADQNGQARRNQPSPALSARRGIEPCWRGGNNSAALLPAGWLLLQAASRQKRCWHIDKAVKPDRWNVARGASGEGANPPSVLPDGFTSGRRQRSRSASNPENIDYSAFFSGCRSFSLIKLPTRIRDAPLFWGEFRLADDGPTGSIRKNRPERLAGHPGQLIRCIIAADGSCILHISGPGAGRRFAAASAPLGASLSLSHFHPPAGPTEKVGMPAPCPGKGVPAPERGTGRPFPQRKVHDHEQSTERSAADL